MAESQAYIRFDRTIPGRSSYRPGEGWIDVRAHGPAHQGHVPGGPGSGGRPSGAGGYAVWIDGRDPAVPLIVQAGQAGSVFRTAVIHFRAGAGVRQVALTEAVIASVRVGEVCDFVLNFKALATGPAAG